MVNLKALKVSLAKEYNTKDLGEVKTIIGSQIYWDLTADRMIINQSAFIQDLFMKEKLTDCNSNVISIKASLFNKMIDQKNYEEADLRIYQ